ncbi:MFS transporter [Streptomyces sp. NPDC087300]|uniref:MFS transporter n=1 Tax=Streptomyces sp. NPDC087300 TaxID=3365780 RepID=UPI00382D32F5
MFRVLSGDIRLLCRSVRSAAIRVASGVRSAGPARRAANGRGGKRAASTVEALRSEIDETWERRDELPRHSTEVRARLDAALDLMESGLERLACVSQGERLRRRGQPGGHLGAFRGTLTVLHHRAFRIYTSGQLAAFTGTWMIRIGQDWLVLRLTGSSTAVGVTIALQFMPLLLFGLPGGVLADRFPERLLLLTTQASSGLAGLTLAVLAFTETITAWHIYATAPLVGLAAAVDNPTRQSYVGELVDARDMRNAVALSIAVFQLSRVLGPAAAGALLTTADSGWAFLAGALALLGPMRSLTALRPCDPPQSVRTERSTGRLKEALRYLSSQPQLATVVALSALTGTFGYTYPVWLTASPTVPSPQVSACTPCSTRSWPWALTGALLPGRRGPIGMRELISYGLVLGLLEAAAAAAAPTVSTFTALIILVGVFSMVFSTRTNAHIQLATPPHLRGRVLGLYVAGFVGGTSVGSPVIGRIADLYGSRAGLLASGSICVLTISATALTGVPSPDRRARCETSARRKQGPATARARSPPGVWAGRV